MVHLSHPSVVESGAAQLQDYPGIHSIAGNKTELLEKSRAVEIIEEPYSVSMIPKTFISEFVVVTWVL